MNLMGGRTIGDNRLCRTSSERNGCTFSYRVTSGNILPVGHATMTFGYSWDSMVHFDKLVVQDYVREFA